MSPTPEELYIANEKLARKCLLRFFPALANDEDVLQTREWHYGELAKTSSRESGSYLLSRTLTYVAT